jgi:hypothetical protein
MLSVCLWSMLQVCQRGRCLCDTDTVALWRRLQTLCACVCLYFVCVCLYFVHRDVRVAPVKVDFDLQASPTTL